MAPAATGAARPVKDDNDADQAKLAVWKDALYDKVREAGREDDSWSQEELLDLDVIPKRDNNLLMRVVQGLSDDKLFFTLRESSGQVSWKWREVEEAQK
jgi:DNA-directed RNA polymerase III subunit RPC6